MSIVFYCASGSPYAWRVWLALEHKQIPYTLNMLSFDAGETRAPGFRKLNPRQRVPVIVDGDFALYESAAIVEYLEERYSTAPDRALFPAETRARAIVRRLIREVDQYFAEGVERLVEQILFAPGERRDEAQIQKGRRQCPSWMSSSARYRSVPGRKTGRGGFRSLSAPSLMLRLERRSPELGVSPRLGPELSAWMRRIESLPYFAKTYPPHWRPS